MPQNKKSAKTPISICHPAKFRIPKTPKHAIKAGWERGRLARTKARQRKLSECVIGKFFGLFARLVPKSPNAYIICHPGQGEAASRDPERFYWMDFRRLSSAPCPSCLSCPFRPYLSRFVNPKAKSPNKKYPFYNKQTRCYNIRIS